MESSDYQMLNMQVGNEETRLNKHNSLDCVLALDGGKNSITGPSSSFAERSYSVHSFSTSSDLQTYEEESEDGADSFLKNLLCFPPLYSLFSWRQRYSKPNSTGAKTSWEISSDRVSDLYFIGSGAYGNVYRGFLDGEVVAVKEVAQTGKLSTDLNLLKKLKHPNIVNVIGICIDCPKVRIVMEYCRYGSLYDELRSVTSISPHKVLNWAIQIAEGMNYLHKYKVIHRDLKSPNILISYNDVLKITDFGTSCRWNGISIQMACTGTYRWMAPEVITSELCSEKVDIWSYGVVLWELLTCEIPYEELESFQVMFGVGNNSICLHVPQTFPECFKYILHQCWNRNPTVRPSFQGILKHLQQKTTEEEIHSIRMSSYFVLQANWKSEIDLEQEKQKTRSSSNSKSSQLKSYAQSLHDILHESEQQILRRRCCSKGSTDSVLRPENVDCPKRTFRKPCRHRRATV